MLGLILIICMCASPASGDYYMSASGMRALLGLEQNISKAFLSHYRAQVAKMVQLERILEDRELTIDGIATDKPRSDIGNPTKTHSCNHCTHTMFKRFAQVWKNFARFQSPKFAPPAYKTVELLYSSNAFDQQRELRGSILGLVKLQETYEMSVQELSGGADQYSQALTLLDVFTVGYYAMGSKFYNLARLWLEEAYQRYQSGPDRDMGPYDYHKLLEAVAWASFKEDDYESAVNYTELQLEERYSQESHENLVWYRTEAEKCKKGPPCKKRIVVGQDDGQDRDYLNRLNKMCRGAEKMTQEDVNGLNCWYFAPSPHFYLKPMQLEHMYHDPDILYFHNLLEPWEVDALINKARGNLETARVFSAKNLSDPSSGVNADYRASKNYWFEKEDQLANRIITRVGHLLNINTRYAEQLQIANYGIGGNYESHFDYVDWPHDLSVFGSYNFGNRIATLLLYLSNVKKGGDTAFVNTGQGVSVPPKKGAGVFWYNLLRNGDGNEKTRHAGCPVLYGEKWIANLWIHEWGHEFRRPCALDPNI